MNLERAFDDVVQLAQHAKDPQAALRALVEYLDPDGKVLAPLAKTKIERDIASVRTQLQALLTAEPPPSNLDAIYFGLFDTEDDDGEDAIGYYVSGIKGFRPNDSESLVNPIWFPDERFLTSSTLGKLKQAELAASDEDLGALASALAYAGQLGVVMLISKFASEGLFIGLPRVVGFDSGDFAQLG